MTDLLAPTPVPPTPPAPGPGARWRGAWAGLLAALVALATGSLVAGLYRGGTSPLDAVGSEFIDRTPRWLKDLAIDWFGTNDKRALRIGMDVTIAVLALAIGALAARRRWVGPAGFATFGIVGALAAQHRPDAEGLDVLPPLLAAVAGAAVLAVLLDLWSPIARSAGAATARSPRPDLVGMLAGRDRKVEVGRRTFLVSSGVALGVAGVAGGLGRSLRRRFEVAASRADLVLPAASDIAPATAPGTSFAIDGLSPLLTPNADFYRIDTALAVPQVPAGSWRLRIHGMVERELELTFDDLLARPLVERPITLTCVSNEVGGKLVGTSRFRGALLAPLLAEAGVQPGADQLVMTSADGWTCGAPVAVVTDGRDAMLAVAMDGEPLPVEHGFPVRAVVPGLYGYVSACKWIVDLEVTTFADTSTYWVDRGWAADGPIKTQSRIDVPKPLARITAGPTAIAGVAWAQHVGVQGVEVRVDGGPWQAADLADALSVDTWRQWKVAWEATSGRHLLEVRATDASGATQPEDRLPPFPDGATGWHSVVVQVD